MSVPGSDERRGRRKACHVSSVHGPLDHRILYKECVSLAEAGYDVCYVCATTESATVRGVRIRAVAPPTRGRVERMASTVMQAMRAALHENADIYHLHDPELLMAAPLLRSLGRRFVYDAHEDLPLDVAIKTYLPRWVRRPLSGVLRVTEPTLARLADGVVVPVDYLQARFWQFGAKRVVTLHNYPHRPKPLTASAEPHGDLRIVYVGSLSPFRGIQTNVEAMGHVPDDVPARLVLYGVCDPPDLLESMRSNPGYNRVDYHGVIDNASVPAALAGADVGIATLKATEAYTRTIPTKLFDYMSAGLPVIVSDFPLWREFIAKHNCGICVDPDDPSAIARAITTLWANPEERARLGANGRRASADLCWEREGEKLLALYDDVMGNGRYAPRAVA